MPNQKFNVQGSVLCVELNARKAPNGKAFEMNGRKACKDSLIVTGVFLVNDHYAYVLFDTGANLSFVSKKFELLLNIKPNKLENKYSIELANRKLIETEEIIRAYSVQLTNQKFEVDLLQVEFGSFDIVLGMDWLLRYQAEIIYSEKQVRIPLPNGEILSVHGDRSNSNIKFINVEKV
ncbi:uncharacterized protein LOC143539369 [Bidens hawaiensis]|uniref:uncharacterized protein LOC143539369 n=1 Tax=Bidens hawaiensis TaxID=980011 RepID=UPI00404A488E